MTGKWVGEWGRLTGTVALFATQIPEWGVSFGKYVVGSYHYYMIYPVSEVKEDDFIIHICAQKLSKTKHIGS